MSQFLNIMVLSIKTKVKNQSRQEWWAFVIAETWLTFAWSLNDLDVWQSCIPIKTLNIIVSGGIFPLNTQQSFWTYGSDRKLHPPTTSFLAEPTSHNKNLKF